MTPHKPDQDEEQPLKYDSFAKDVLGLALERLGEVKPQHPITSHPQYADIWFNPHPRRTPASFHPLLTLLHTMGSSASIFEPFRNSPSIDDCLDVLNKGLTLHRKQRPRTRKDWKANPHYQQPHTWLISPYHPQKPLAALGATPDTKKWRPGFFALPQALNAHVVVVRLLPRTPETLLLRLMGRGRTQKQAMEDLQALEPDEVTAAISELIDCWSVVAMQTPEHQRDNPTQELLMNIYERVQEERQRRARIRQEERQEDRQAGQEELMLQLFSRRLARDLSQQEAQRIKEHLRSAGPDHLSSLLFDLSPLELARWLDDPNAE